MHCRNNLQHTFLPPLSTDECFHTKVKHSLKKCQQKHTKIRQHTYCELFLHLFRNVLIKWNSNQIYCKLDVVKEPFKTECFPKTNFLKLSKIWIKSNSQICTLIALDISLKINFAMNNKNGLLNSIYLLLINIKP